MQKKKHTWYLHFHENNVYADLNLNIVNITILLRCYTLNFER